MLAARPLTIWSKQNFRGATSWLRLRATPDTGHGRPFGGRASPVALAQGDVVGKQSPRKQRPTREPSASSAHLSVRRQYECASGTGGVPDGPSSGRGAVVAPLGLYVQVVCERAVVAAD